MAKKKTKAAKPKATKPRSFGGVVRGRTAEVQRIAMALRDLVYEELPDAQESFYGGKLPMAMYRTDADVCWIQPLKERCNVYFVRGPELEDEEELLEGNSDRMRHVKVVSAEHIEELPLREWIRESVALNQAAASVGIAFDDAHQRLQKICLALPHTKETETWGKPHFRVGEKIFCGCGEEQGSARLGLKMELSESRRMMKMPGIEKAPYSRKDDGWVSINPSLFDDWEEIERFVVGSYQLVAPKRLLKDFDR